MAFDRLADISFRIFQRRASGYTAGKSGHVSGPIVLCLLKNNRVSYTHWFFSTPAAL